MSAVCRRCDEFDCHHICGTVAFLLGLGIGIIITSFHIDGTLPFLKVLLKASNRNCRELSVKMSFDIEYHHFLEQFYGKTTSQIPSFFAKNRWYGSFGEVLGVCFDDYATYLYEVCLVS